MMLSQTAEYVLRVVVFLAAQKGEPVTTRQIAEATRVPSGYLAKLLQALGRANVVDSQRGLHGGFVMTRKPEELTVYDVVSIVSPPQRIHTCPLGLPSHGHQLCALHQRLDDALATVEKAFRESTIAELLTEDRPSQPLCDSTPAPVWPTTRKEPRKPKRN